MLAIITRGLPFEFTISSRSTALMEERQMAVAAQNTNNTTIRSILQQEKLTGPNFTKWYRNLRIVLRSEGKLAHLEQPLIPLPLPIAPQAVRDTYEVLYDAQNEVACLMLGNMSLDL
ncbi:hypothetical protein Tco_1089183 [Tanacetum coccineum]